MATDGHGDGLHQKRNGKQRLGVEPRQMPMCLLASRAGSYRLERADKRVVGTDHVKAGCNSLTRGPARKRREPEDLYPRLD